MTAEAFAELVEARSAGAGKWQARCPAHEDRRPSLSIRKGRDGRVVLHCFGGCELDAILKATGLRMADLFEGPPPSPEQAAVLRTAREAQERAERVEQQTRRDAWDYVRKWQAIVDALGAKLARAPEGAKGDALCKTFHRACYSLHVAETEAEQLESSI
jgi:hypothetical protein